MTRGLFPVFAVGQDGAGTGFGVADSAGAGFGVADGAGAGFGAGAGAGSGVVEPEPAESSYVWQFSVSARTRAGPPRSAMSDFGSAHWVSAATGLATGAASGRLTAASRAWASMVWTPGGSLGAAEVETCGTTTAVPAATASVRPEVTRAVRRLSPPDRRLNRLPRGAGEDGAA